MDKSTNYVSKNTYSTQQTQTITKPKRKFKKCNECNKKRKSSNENLQICYFCYEAKKIPKSGNKVIDDFIRYTHINDLRKGKKINFIPYRFENVEFIAEGGFSKIYKAIWIDSPYSYWDHEKQSYSKNYPVVLKKLNNSKNVTSKELNELKIFYEFSLKSNAPTDNTCISNYYGITQDPITQDIMIITNDFYSISWYDKLNNLYYITRGLKNIHEVNIVHRDLHSGNIFNNVFLYTNSVVIGDLGISKSATTDDNNNNNENYGIIPYMAPEIFQGQKYTTASDIYSFGMIMWEFMTGRRPFWNKIHDTELIIEICDGLRPPIVTNAPEGYIDLMKECWHPDPEKRPSTITVEDKIWKIYYNEPYSDSDNRTKIIKSPDIGPVSRNNPGAIYKSRPLSGMIQSAMSTRSSRSQSINLETDLFRYYQKSHMSIYDKRKFDDQIENNFNGKIIKKLKLIENEYNDYVTKEFELDVDTNFKQYKNDYEYKTREIDFDFDIDTF